MLYDRVRCNVPNPGAVGIGSAITLGATVSGYRSFLGAVGASKPCYFVLSDGAGKALTGVWTVNSGGTATITEILGNDRLGGTAGETFTGSCTAWCALPAVELPLMRDGPMAGLRNLLINANPIINQRGYTSGAAVGGANAYTLDRWRVVTAGQALSWVDSAGIRTVTAPAGGVEQVIEAASILGGVHTLSWQGTAVALINGAAVTNGGQVTLAGGANATLRFTGGTWALAQLEPGPRATPFERRPYGIELYLCQRYYETGTCLVGYSAYTTGTLHYFPIAIVPKRTSPTVTSSGTAFTNIFSAAIYANGTALVADIQANFAGNCAITMTFFANAEL